MDDAPVAVGPSEEMKEVLFETCLVVYDVLVPDFVSIAASDFRSHFPGRFLPVENLSSSRSCA